MTVPPSLLPLEPFPTAPDTRASTPHIRLHGLGKRYPGGVQALREIDLEIRRGEVFGIIGRSGAGKSSLIRTLNRLERPSEGQVLIDDEDIGGYDGQRLARALVHQPQILLCDEATSALDPESTQAILALLRDINRRLGLTIVLITHEMAVIREICDRVVVLECGRIVEQGEVWEVFGDPRHAVTRSLLGSLRAALPADLQARLRQAPGAGDPVLLDLQYTGASRRVPDLLAIARAIGQRVDLLHGGIERIQGRALGRLLLQVGAPPGELPGVLAKAALVADKVEVLGHVAHA